VELDKNVTNALWYFVFVWFLRYCIVCTYSTAVTSRESYVYLLAINKKQG
jgi:hypothetical protein